jgi:hypothetical protein
MKIGQAILSTSKSLKGLELRIFESLKKGECRHLHMAFGHFNTRL